MNKKDILEEFKALRKETIYNYEYAYFKEDIYGSFIIDTNLNNTFGDKREGYEKFKNSLEDATIEYAGVISLREVFNKNKEEDKIFIMEKKLSHETYSDRLIELEKKAKNHVIAELKIQDLESFEYFLEDKIEVDFRTKPDITLHNVKYYLSLLDSYNNDEDFRRYFDKIIK